MKKGFKVILVVIIIICGVKYVLDYIGIELKDISFNENKLELNNEEEIQVNGNNINMNTELMLVNREYGLDKDYRPEELVVPDILFADGVESEEKHVSVIIARHVEALVNAAKDEGIILLGNSGYRSYKLQGYTYRDRVKTQGKELADAYVAKPGFSEHQTGLSIDITNESGFFSEGTIEAQWLAGNCHRFGFIIRYPYGKKDITGVEYEPWHIRYVGKEAAKYIYDNEITLEEYLGK